MNANISIIGGSAGTYILCVYRDISLWPDEQVATFQFSHGGTTTTKSFTFTPAVASPYHLSLVFNGTTLWSQPNNATRLNVRAPVTTAFSVTSYGFSPNSVTLGASVNANISINGGSSGTYTLCVWRGISMWPDEQVATLQFTHGGADHNKELPVHTRRGGVVSFESGI